MKLEALRRRHFLQDLFLVPLVLFFFSLLIWSKPKFKIMKMMFVLPNVPLITFSSAKNLVCLELRAMYLQQKVFLDSGKGLRLPLQGPYQVLVFTSGRFIG